MLTRPENAEASVTLPDGRKLAYFELGDPAGVPVLYFHGSPASRVEPLLVGSERFAQLGLRVIAPDRPGMGASDFQQGRRLVDWPLDVAVLADALRLPRFALLGNSGGGPYVAVCAARIPERIVSAAITSGGWRMDWPEARDGMPFMNRLVMTLARRAPPLLGLLLASMKGVATGERDKELAQMKGRMPAPDYEASAEPGRLEAFGAMMRESLRQGAKGPVWDMRLYVRDFGFDPREVRVPIALFHGELDANSPIALARKVAALLPGSRLVTYPGEAHLSTLCNRFDDVAQVLRRA